MSMYRQTGQFPRPSLPFVLLVAFCGVLWLAGGASRADVLAQVIVRSFSAFVLIVLALGGDRPRLRDARPVLYLLLASLALVLLQLIPLPPSIWQALPGRTAFIDAAAATGEAQPWRPWAIVPGSALNSASSLIVPLTMLLLVTSLKPLERGWLPGLILGFVVAAMLVGLLQLSGVGLNNPFVNDTPGQISGSFANRNHLALFLALGCVIAPVWAFLNGRQPKWRISVALGLMLLLPLTIVASGSRAGMLLCIMALVLGPVLARREIRKVLRRYPRWTFPALIAACVGVIGAFVLISVTAGRALSIDRVVENDPGQDMRAKGLPTVLEMIKEYFPAGSGFGGFDPLFRMHEPFALLKLTYFNHVHNDWLEVVLDAGLPGFCLLLAGLLWWGWASIRVWRGDQNERRQLATLGSVMLCFVFLASIFDYPARTPTIMATVVIAGLWLSEGASGSRQHGFTRV